MWHMMTRGIKQVGYLAATLLIALFIQKGKLFIFWGMRNLDIFMQNLKQN